MKKFIILASTILTLTACQQAVQPPPSKQPEPAGNDQIQIESPLAHETISSPLTIKGEVRGYWMFEATFHVFLEDMEGNEIANTPIMTSANWMTEDFVPFEETLTFSAGDAKEGKLIFRQHDASGPDEGPEPRSFEMPVRFSDER